MHSSAWIANAIVTPAAVAAVISPVVAQTWRDRPVKTVLRCAPAGATDAIHRPWAEAASAVVIEKSRRRQREPRRHEGQDALTVRVGPEELGHRLVEDIEAKFMVINASSIKVE